MTLTELSKVIIRKNPTTKRRWTFWKKDSGYSSLSLKHARRAWQGKAYLIHFSGYIRAIYIFTENGSGPYGLSVEDALADDWEVVE